MGYGKECSSSRSRTEVDFKNPCKTATTRRCFMPEPSPCCNPTKTVCIEQCVQNKKHRRRKPSKYFNITHASCLTTIKSYVDRFQNPNKHKLKKRSHRTRNAEKLLCSLKNDIQTISKYEQDAMDCPDQKPSSDPFFVLSAMMCKINKLETILMSDSHSNKKMHKRKEILNTARDIRQSLIKQIACDEKMLKEKRQRLCSILETLECFEKELCASVNKPAIKDKVSAKKSTSCVKICSKKKSKEKCVTLPVKVASNKCLSDKNKYEITGVNVVYTKSHVSCDPRKGKMEDVKSKLCCSVNKEDETDCEMKIVKDGCNVSCTDPELKKKINCMSKVWFESARLLIDAFAESSC